MGFDPVAGSTNKADSVLGSLKISVKKPDESKSEDKKIDISSDKVIKIGIGSEKGTVPNVEKAVSESLTPIKGGTFVVGQHTFPNIRQVTPGYELDDAQKITSGNKIDEVFFSTEDGKLFVAYGTQEDKGALNTDHVKEGYIGKFSF